MQTNQQLIEALQAQTKAIEEYTAAVMLLVNVMSDAMSEGEAIVDEVTYMDGKPIK